MPKQYSIPNNKTCFSHDNSLCLTYTHMCCHERSNVSVNVFYYLIVLSKAYLLFSCEFIEKIIGERTKGHVCSEESRPNNESK